MFPKPWSVIASEPQPEREVEPQPQPQSGRESFKASIDNELASLLDSSIESDNTKSDTTPVQRVQAPGGLDSLLQDLETFATSTPGGTGSAARQPGMRL